MQLQSIVTPAKPAAGEKVAYTGQDGGIIVEDGQKYKIEVAPDGAEVLDVGPPPGKKWTVYTKVDIQESDV